MCVYTPVQCQETGQHECKKFSPRNTQIVIINSIHTQAHTQKQTSNVESSHQESFIHFNFLWILIIN